MSRGGLLSYYGTEEDDYHQGFKPIEKSPSKRYDELTQSLQTGNKEYGLHYPEGTPRDHYLQSDSQDGYDFMSGGQKARAGKRLDAEGGGETPHFGRRRLITKPGANGGGSLSDTRSLGGVESPPLLPRRAMSRDRPTLPKVTNSTSPRAGGTTDYSYKDVQKSYMSSKTADSVRLSDIAQIDLVLTLNDKTKVVIKAAPFKPFNF